ncbi:AraC family transcriptional regulator [Funiculus sociatus GB2-A5]|uniref:AraC family transcriptional regulator n=1 Tax=Funiculus sociatus GB2-A5 TaxID=2933946 RepID=A0ABV0JN43_9CYAN|nr:MULTISPECIES: AraC family transcriptional regulator [unclassified Trichocoleus]MBD1907863.1 helix-turn-helix transcriptional regulator [Trichocoleus sp. FACHB-832]MBD2064041.1 helix-turn-helix transcriptional regulator [Trichocoleus sp. FACHB-6]
MPGLKPKVGSSLKAEWDSITVEYSLTPPGENDKTMPKHLVGVAFAPHERVTWCVDGGSSQTTSLHPGSVFLYSSCEFVWLHSQRPSECVHMMLDPNLLSRVAAENSLSSNVEIDYRVMFADPTILHLAQLFKSEMLNGGLAGKLYTESLTNLLAVHLLRNYSGTRISPALQDGALDTPRLSLVKDFIEEHLAENLSIADLASVVHISPFHFARAFKTATGQPPHRYITHRRMERAKMLLSVTRLPVAEVAYRVGFSNQSHFTAQFRRATGTTPKGYRDSL